MKNNNVNLVELLALNLTRMIIDTLVPLELLMEDVKNVML